MTIPENFSSEHEVGPSDTLEQWRITFLNTVLRVVAGLGFVILAASIPTMNPPRAILFGSVYMVILVAAVMRLPHALKASILVGSGYFVGLYLLIQEGPWSNAFAFLLGTTLFTALITDTDADRWLLGINVMSLAVIGALNISGNLALNSVDVPTPVLLDWLTYAADYLVLSLALLWAINLLKSEFRSTTDRLQSAISLLTNDHAGLEKQLEMNTAGLINKIDKMRAAAYIIRQAAELQDLEAILKLVVNLTTDQFGLYHAGIFLMNESGDEVVLVSASSEGGRRMIEKGYSVRVDSSNIVGYAASQRKPLVSRIDDSGVFPFADPELPLTHSEIALPLIIRNRMLGVLDIQSEQRSAFSVEDIDIYQSLADQVAVAIDNTRLLDESHAALMQVEALTGTRTLETWSQIINDRPLSYTFSPLGIRSGRVPEETDSTLKIPITLRGQKIGTISLSRKDNAPWSEIDRNMVSEIANQTGLAIDNVRLVEEATQRAKQEQTVGSLSARFSQLMDIDTLLQTAARELGQVPDVAEVSVFIGDFPEQISQKSRSRRIAGGRS